MHIDDIETMWRDPSNWGRFESYRCAADPRLFVPKRNGGGWTLNMAHPRSQAVLWIALVAILGVAAAIFLGVN